MLFPGIGVFHLRLLLVIGLLFSPSLAASQADTLRRYTGGEVVVEESRAEREYAIPAVAVRSEQTEKLTQLSGSTRASDFIRLLTPSLSLRSYGTLGGITLSSYRGLPPEYTIIFRDGIRLTNEQNSLTDLGRITSASLTRADLLSSNASILLGGDAVAASLNLSSYAPTVTSFSVGSRQTSNDQLRSVGEQEYFTSLSYNRDGWGIGGAFNRQTSKGDYPYLDRFSGREVRRENNDATLSDLVLAGSFKAEDLEMASTLSYVNAERGAPGGAVVEGRGASQFNARQADEDHFLSIRAKTKVVGWTLAPALAWQSQSEQYIDPDKIDAGTGTTINDSYVNRLYFAEVKTDGHIREGIRSYSGLQLQENHLFSNQTVRDGDTAVKRTRFGAYSALSIKPMSGLTFNAAGRAEWISDLNIWKGLPQLHVQYTFDSIDLTLNANYGKSFHAPTFNQLYWRRFGNLDLRHEQGDNFEFGALLRTSYLDKAAATLRATGFRASVKDQILWLPQSNGDYSPINIQNARTQGLELRGVVNLLLDHWLALEVDAAYTVLDAENLTEGEVKGKRLPYSAATQGVTRIQFSSLSFGSIALVSEYRGARYGNVSNDKLSKLDPFNTITMNFVAPAIELMKDSFLLLNLAVLNLADAKYYEILNYPMAGRTVRVGVELKFSPNSQ